MTAKELIAKAAACADCGEEHKPIRLPNNGISWAKNGHSYRPQIYVMTNQSAGPVLAALRKLAS